MNDGYSSRPVTITLPEYTIRHIQIALRRAGYLFNLDILNGALGYPQVLNKGGFNIPGWDLS